MKKIICFQLAAFALSCLFGALWGEKMAYLTFLTLIFFLYSLAVNAGGRKIVYLWVMLPVFAYVLFRFSKGFDGKILQNSGLWGLIYLPLTMMLVGYAAGYLLSKCKPKTVRTAMLIAAALILSLTCNTISRSLGFVAIGAIFLLAPYLAYRYISQKLYMPLIIAAPLTLLNLEPWLAGSISTLPVTLAHLFSLGVYYLAFALRRKRVAQIMLIGVYSLLLMYGGCKGYRDYVQWVSVQQNKSTISMPADFSFYELDGQPVTSESMKGKIVVLDFWSTSCGVCFREFPEFDRVCQKYRHRDDIAFYAVNLPHKQDTKEGITKTIAKHVSYSFPVALAEEDSGLRERFNITGVPRLVIVDRDGKVVFNGSANYDKRIAYNIENMIDRLLE